ncbi:hypothetical protein SDC9_105759 [bioreactor metagenome]|uniref:Uncharacterized protein n=1 Tax=bioreactor metagenome TaxID=1076179 RepID=A0A645BB48_9ZZZZ
MVLGVEARERRDADDGQVADREGDERPRHHLAQRTEVPHVGVVVHGMHHRTGTQEHVGLEEAVGEQMEDRECAAGRADARGQHHVADLAHGRTGEHLLDVVLGGPDPGAGQQCDHTDDADRQRGGGGQLVDRVAAHHQVDAGGDHGRGVDERRHRGGALHRVQQPGLQRHLGRLATGGQQQEQTQRSQPAGARGAGRLVDLGEIHRAEQRDHGEHREQQPEVTDAVDHEGLLGCQCRGMPLLPETDQQVGRQADTLPADEQQRVVVGQHQRQHRHDEQVQECEEATAVRVVGHVADRVDEDQRSDPGHQQREENRQLVDQQGGLQIQAADADPVEHRHVHRPLVDRCTEHLDPQHRRDDERTQRAEYPEPMAPGVGGFAAEQQDRRHHQGYRDHQPGVGEQPSGFHRDDDFQQTHHSPLSASAGSGRRPRPSGGS